MIDFKGIGKELRVGTRVGFVLNLIEGELGEYKSVEKLYCPEEIQVLKEAQKELIELYEDLEVKDKKKKYETLGRYRLDCGGAFTGANNAESFKKRMEFITEINKLGNLLGADREDALEFAAGDQKDEAMFKLCKNYGVKVKKGWLIEPANHKPHKNKNDYEMGM